ncbi:AmpG family muropeptide MFS transporter [Sphingobium nicotianae]|uniref:MFS transporter n=1 Tax=Sphingobium nicotianae TaxID=2782607 RepID=A0A9X1DBY1_9SPHN|nr:MFS transporter [Sphingobium nicotianae]MBT2187131.1 MFS transporter [Sphingobium nicotianae]
MADGTTKRGWGEAIKPYLEREPLIALFLGISSGFPFALLAATLTNRLSEAGVTKSSISAFALALLVYSFKWIWAPIIDRARLPLLSDALGQRRSWLWLCGVAVALAVIVLGLADPVNDIRSVVIGALLLGFAGATFDIVIDAYRIELLKPEQLGIGSGMSQYGWRLGSFFAASIALAVANVSTWTLGYIACAPLAFAGPIASLFGGEPMRHHEPRPVRSARAALQVVIDPLVDFFKREGAVIVLLFVLVHKIGDTIANLMIRDLLVTLGFTKPEILTGDVWVGFFALLAGIFVGGILYARLGMKRSVLVSLILMGVSNLSFAGLAAAGHSMPMLAFTIGFENFASGIGGVTVVAYLSALCDLRFTATQFALLSAGAAILGRFITGTTAGALIEALGYVNFYLLTTLLALPGILIFWWMMRTGLVDASIGDAGREEPSTQTGG